MSSDLPHESLIVDPSLFTVDPLLLGFGQSTSLPAREYFDRVTSWASGGQDHAVLALEYADKCDFTSAAQCARRADTSVRPQLARDLLTAWQEWRETHTHRLQRAIVLADAQDPEVAAELQAAIALARGSLDALPPSTEDGVNSLADLPASRVQDVSSAFDLVDDEEQSMERARVQRERLQRERLLQLKQQADNLLGELLLDPNPDVASDDIDATQSALMSAYRARSVRDVERLLERLRALQRGETLPLPSITATTQGPRRPQMSEADLDPSRLSTYTARALGHPPADVPSGDVLHDLDQWGRAELEKASTVARRIAFAPEPERASKALGAFLFIEGKRRLVDDPSAAIPFLVDAFRWTCSSNTQERLAERHAAAVWMLLALRLFFLSGFDRRSLFERMGGRAHRDIRSVQEHLRELDRQKLFAEVTEPLIRCGRAAGNIFLREYLLPYVEAHPRTAERLAERWIQHIASPSTSAFQTAAAAEQLWTLLEASGLPFRNDRRREQLTEAIRVAKNDADRRSARRQILAETKHVVHADDAELVLAASTMEAIDHHLPWLDLDPTEAPKLTQRTLTPSIHGSSHRIVIEVRLLEGDIPLRHVVPTIELFDVTGGHRIGTIENVAPIPMLSDRPIEIYGKWRGEELPREQTDLKLRAQYEIHGFDGIRRPLEIRSKNLSLDIVQPRQERFVDNPYMVGKTVVNPERIYGREEQLTAVRQALGGSGAGNVVMVKGERRIGKSTFLHLLANDRQIQQRFIVAFSKFENAPKNRDLGALLRGCPAEDVRRTLVAHGLPSPPFGFDGHLGPADAFRHYMRAVDELLVARSQRLLVIMDELDQLLENDNLGEEAVAALRSVVADAKAIWVVLAGATEIMARRPLTRDDRLFRLAVDIPLPPLSIAGATRLLQDPAKAYFEITGPAVDLALQQTNRQPYLLQRVGFDLFKHMDKLRAPIACQLDVEEVLGPIGGDGPTYYDFFRYLPEGSLPLVKAIARLQVGWGYVGIEDVRRELARRGLRLTRSDLADRLSEVKRLAPLVLEEKMTTRAYRLSVGLFARHLRMLEDEPDR